MAKLAKLDTFDYDLLPGIIRIKMTSTRDAWIHDIIHEIDKSDGNIYVEGERYTFLEYEITQLSPNEVYLDLRVVLNQ